MNISSVLLRYSLFLLPLLAIGCVSGPMTIHASRSSSDRIDRVSDPAKARIEVVRGNPNKAVDGLGWVLGIPRKVILWDKRVDNHNVQPETMAEVATFAETSQIDGICIRVNQYAPIDEWKRLTQNDRISPGWRYTMGTLSLVGYTLLPGRIVGGDNYNPYTNSVYIHSDIPALAMEAAAYAKDVQSREFPGTYAAVNQLPLVSIWHETINTRETLEYLQTHGTYEDQEEGLAILYPNYGASVGGALGSVLGVPPVFEVGGAVVGHISGRHKAAQVNPGDMNTAWLETTRRGDHDTIRLKGAESSASMDSMTTVSSR